MQVTVVTDSKNVFVIRQIENGFLLSAHKEVKMGVAQTPFGTQDITKLETVEYMASTIPELQRHLTNLMSEAVRGVGSGD